MFIIIDIRERIKEHVLWVKTFISSYFKSIRIWMDVKWNKKKSFVHSTNEKQCVRYTWYCCNFNKNVCIENNKCKLIIFLCPTNMRKSQALRKLIKYSWEGKLRKKQMFSSYFLHFLLISETLFQEVAPKNRSTNAT